MNIEERKHLSEIMKKRWESGEMTKLFSTKEYREKKKIIALALGFGQCNIGRKATQETKEKMSKNNARFWFGKKRSLETNKKISISLKGKISTKRKLTWKAEWLKRQIMERANFKCQKCGDQTLLQVDHIMPRYKFPELANVVENIQVLCSFCHQTKTLEDFVIYGNPAIGNKGNKGGIPWNKDKKLPYEVWNKGRVGYMGANRTSFKKGMVPWNKKKVEETITV